MANELSAKLDICEILALLFGRDNMDSSYLVSQIGIELGTLSSLYQIVVDLKDTKQFSFILKIPKEEGPLIGQMNSVGVLFSDIIHKIECKFYQMICDLPEVFPVPTPKCYLHRQGSNSFLALEDLSNNAVCPDIMLGLSLEQTNKIVQVLANLHAYCWKSNDWTEYVAPLQSEMIPDLSQLLEVAWGTLKSDFPAHINQISEETFSLLQSLAKQFCSDPLEFYGELPNVIVHGDLWINNLMFKLSTEDRQCTSSDLIAIIDWQFCHRGSFTQDLARLLISCCNFELVKDNKSSIIDAYFATLSRLADKDLIERCINNFDVLYRKSAIVAVVAYVTELPELLQTASKGPNSDINISNLVGRLLCGLKEIEVS